jgi:hypothetical protein
MTAIRHCLAAAALAWGAAVLPIPAAAQSSPLSGLWIAIDDGFPALVGAGILIPTEEILHVSTDGRAESRLLTINGFETHYMCATGWGCSDMLAVREAVAEMNGGSLVFRNRQATAEAGKITQSLQSFVAGLTVIASSPQWVASFEADGNRLRLETANQTRIFARIDPDYLNRLRAALQPLSVSYAVHWRCFLSNATANNAAFDPVGGPRRAPPGWFGEYLNAALVLHRFEILASTPTQDDDLAKSMPELAKAATMQVTNSVLGAAVNWPKTVQEKLRYRAPVFVAYTTAKTGDEAIALQGGRKLDPNFAGTGISSGGMQALAKVLRGYETDSEIRNLFCLDLKDPPEPRTGLFPFRGVQPPK